MLEKVKTFNNLKESRDYIINFLRKIENDESLYGVCSDIRKNIQLKMIDGVTNS